MAKEAMTATAMASFNVRDFGATGNKQDDAQTAINKAIATCAEAGGGMVYFPPGAYTTGTIHLRSHVRIFVEAGATIYSSKEPSSFDQRALFYGEDLENITLEGRGTVNGQAEYEWRMNNIEDRYIYPNQVLMEKAGLPLMRSFPTPNSVGHLVLLIRCKDVRIAGLSFIDSPSWTMHPWQCQRLVIDGIYIRTSMKYGVWADGIDPDGCKDVLISNCVVETGDDALVFYSSSIYGPAVPCENIVVTNCRLSSASSAIKFCDGNLTAIRNVTISNCAITDSNRGIAFMVFDGGLVSDVVIANITIECRRFDWFWWGEGDPLHFRLIQRSQIDPHIDRTREPRIGAMRNIILQNIIARGPGANNIDGHADSYLENVTLENIRLTVVNDLNSPLQKTRDALIVRRARNLRLKDVEVTWEAPAYEQWRSAVVLEDVEELLVDGLAARQSGDGPHPALLLERVSDATVRNCRAAAGTGTFVRVQGRNSHGIELVGNDFRCAEIAHAIGDEVDLPALSDRD